MTTKHLLSLRPRTAITTATQCVRTAHRTAHNGISAAFFPPTRTPLLLNDDEVEADHEG